MRNSMPTIEQLQSSRLNVQVSCFADYNTVEYCKPVILWKWLLSDKFEPKQAQIRLVNDKDKRDELKATLPAITPAALLHNRVKGNSNCLISLSGFLCIDIDKKDNLDLNNYNDLLQQLPNITNIIFAGESVSGTGYLALIPISNPDKLEQHFRAAEKLLSKYFNIKIDPTKGKNYKDLRGYSYTAKPYFNLNAETFKQMYTEPPKAKHVHKPSKKNSTVALDHITWKIEQLICKIETQKTDLTSDYSDWFTIGMAFASLGGPGRDFYHRVSSFYPDYDINKTDEQFTNCLKSANGTINIRSFFYICKNAGICFEYNLNPAHAKTENLPNYQKGKAVDARLAANEPTPSKTDFKPFRKEFTPVWDIIELQTYFNAVNLPKNPIRLNHCSIINNVKTFVDSHLEILTHNNGNPTFLPYFTRLQELKKQIENKSL